MSDAAELRPSFKCICCNEQRSGAPRLVTSAGKVCDSCEWLHKLKCEQPGVHDPEWRAA